MLASLRLLRACCAFNVRLWCCSRPASRLPCFCGPPREQVVQVVVVAALRPPDLREVADHHAHLGLHAVLVEVVAQEADQLPVLVGELQPLARACARAKSSDQSSRCADSPRSRSRLPVADQQRRAAVGIVASRRAPGQAAQRQRRRRCALRCRRAARARAAAHEGHEARRPAVAAGAAQVGVRGEQVARQHAVVPAVDAVAALHAVGEAGPPGRGSPGSNSGTRGRAVAAGAPVAGPGQVAASPAGARSRGRPAARASPRRPGSRRPSAACGPASVSVRARYISPPHSA